MVTGLAADTTYVAVSEPGLVHPGQNPLCATFRVFAPVRYSSWVALLKVAPAEPVIWNVQTPPPMMKVASTLVISPGVTPPDGAPVATRFQVPFCVTMNGKPRAVQLFHVELVMVPIVAGVV